MNKWARLLKNTYLYERPLIIILFHIFLPYLFVFLDIVI